MGRCLLSSLDRSGAGFRELLIAGVLLFRKSEIGLGLSDICVCLIDRGLLLRNLRVETADIGFSCRHVRLCLVDRRLIVAQIDPQQHLARFDPLVIGHQQLGDVAVDLWDNRDVVRLRISVVGRLEPLPNGVPVPAETDRTNEQKSANDRGNSTACAAVVPALLAARPPVLPRLSRGARSRRRSSGVTRSTRCSIRGRASRSAPPLACRPRVSSPPWFSGTSADDPNTARHRCIIVGHSEEFGPLDRLSTVIGVHEPTSMVRLRRVWSVDDRQAVISCFSKRIAVEDSDLSGSGQPDHTAAFQLSESTAHRLY